MKLCPITAISVLKNICFLLEKWKTANWLQKQRTNIWKRSTSYYSINVMLLKCKIAQQNLPQNVVIWNMSYIFPRLTGKSHFQFWSETEWSYQLYLFNGTFHEFNFRLLFFPILIESTFHSFLLYKIEALSLLQYCLTS